MYRTLAELKKSVEDLIAQQGADAPCASFIFTKDDVFFYPIGEDGFEDLDTQERLSDFDTDEVLTALGGCDYIYEQVFEIIDDEVRLIRKKVSS